MKRTRNLAMGSLFVALIAFAACQKSGMTPGDTDAAFASGNAKLDNVESGIDVLANAAIGTVEQAQPAGNPIPGIFGIITLPDCATVTVDLDGTPKTMTIDFGSTPCLADQWDNMYHQGVIEITWTGPYQAAGTIMTINTTNYYRGESPLQMDQINLSKTVTNTGLNDSGNMLFHIEATLSVTYSTGETASLSVDRWKEWTEGSSTADMSDDVFSITGTSTGTNVNGVTFSSTTTSPLIKTSCQWFVSGAIELTRSNLPTVTIDYGNGTCDNIATLTVNGQTRTITLQ